MLYFALRDKQDARRRGSRPVLRRPLDRRTTAGSDQIRSEFVGPTGQAPTSEYWFGTTTFGQDVFAQFVNGLQATFMVGLLGGGLAALDRACSIGFVAGYRGGIVDEILNMITNIVLVIPTLVVLVVSRRT